MAGAGGQRFFADLGYWSNLQCLTVPADCGFARQRLRSALLTALPNGETVADRVMYGTDWFMLTNESAWSRYPDAVLDSLAQTGAIEKVFGGNAARFFKL
jgi:predicted TIM-barrel fold metal-dependent hydrolase